MKRILLALVCLSAAGAVIGCNMSWADSDLFKKADALLHEGNADGAILELSSVIRLNPDSAEAYYKRGTIFGLLKRDFASAISDFSKVIELAPKFASGYISRGSCYANSGQFKLAIADLTTAIELAPQDALAYENRAAVYEQTGKPGLAIVDKTRAIALTPQRLGIYRERGDLYRLNGEIDRAIADYTKELDMFHTTQDGELYATRARMYFEKKDYDMAWRDVQAAKQRAGYVDEGFLKALREASGREA